MDIERKTCDIRTRKRNFLDTSSTNIDTLVPSLYQCVETRSREVFDSCLSHFRTSVSTSSATAKPLPPSCEPLYATNTAHREQQTFLYEYSLNRVLLPTKNTKEHCSSVVHPQVRSPFWLLKPASEHVHARLLHRLSWSWTVLLPSDTNIKPITSIRAVLHPFVSYLLTILVFYDIMEELIKRLNVSKCHERVNTAVWKCQNSTIEGLLKLTILNSMEELMKLNILICHRRFSTVNWRL
jgi:hypothetical protein